MRQTPYVRMNLTEPARDELRQATLDLAPETGSRLSMSLVLRVALRVALRRRREMIRELQHEIES